MIADKKRWWHNNLVIKNQIQLGGTTLNKKYIISFALTTSILFSPFFNNAEASSLKHRVESGETLWKISQSYNVSVADIKDWNDLSSNTIKPGQTLLVSTPTQTSQYTVKKGDTLSLIAKAHGTTIAELKSMNGLTSDIIYIGQVLKVASQSSTQAPASTNGRYTVVSGDSLSLIAKKHNTTVSDLKSINGLSSDLIFVGQVLNVPNTDASKTNDVEKNATSYTVKSGDTLWGIATKHGLTVSKLKSYNGLTSNNLYVGQVLKLKSNGSVQTPKESNSFHVNALIDEAKKYIGVPYVWAGTSPSGFDCSGFLHYVYLQNGVAIPRTVATIWNAATPVSSPQKGDLVFFETYKAGPSHAGIYLGDGTFIHASTSQGVTISSMNNSYWKTRYLGAGSVK